MATDAIEYTKLMKKYEDMKAAGNEKNEEFGAKEKGWKKTIEDVFSFVKVVRGASANRQNVLKSAEGQEEDSLRCHQEVRQIMMREEMNKTPLSH